MSDGDPAKVAILGGGAAGIAAAYELTRPELEGAFEVTVYTNGWRLGGKGASGRAGAAADPPQPPHRVEEHGLHVWFGFYRNAFRMLDEVYASGCPGIPFRDRAAAFVPIDQLALIERDGRGGYTGADLARCMRPPGRPIDEDDLEGPYRSFAVLLQRIYELIEMARSDREVLDADADLGALDREVASAARIAEEQAGLDRPDAALYHDFAERLEAASAAAELAGSGPLRRLFTTVGLAIAGLRAIADEVLSVLGERAAPFDHLNGIELRELLRLFGASDELLDSAPVRSLYDLAFSYRDGDPARPDVAAGVAIENVLSILFRHDGVMMRKMAGGMGDVVFAPLYTLLRSRGVRFEFFSAVTGIDAEPAGDGGARVTRVAIRRQARLAPGHSAYDPLVELDVPSWPDGPRAEQLHPDDREKLAKLDRGPMAGGARPALALEREANPLGVGQRFELQTEDLATDGYVDEVVLAIPIGAHRSVAAGLLEAHEGLERMERQARPVCTQSFQLWLERDRRALGWPCPDAEHPLLGAYAKPFDTYLDMSHAIEGEAWKDGQRPGSLSFFCGVLPEPDGDRWNDLDWPRAHHRAGGNVASFLAEHARRTPPPFWEHVELQRDVGALAGHYWRANSTGWERYATSHHGAMDARLTADGSLPSRPGRGALENATLAGDWTYTPDNAGSVESAVMSGVEAAGVVIRRRAPKLRDLARDVIKASWRK